MSEVMWIVLIIGLFSILANLFILWIVIKLHTEIFKQAKFEGSIRKIKEEKTND